MNRKSNLPKVLIIGQSFNHDTGGGITLSNLFRNWSRDKLAVACSGYLLGDHIDTELCDNYYQLGYEETKWRFPFNFIQRKYTSGQIGFREKNSMKITSKKSKMRVKLIMGFFVPCIEFFGLSHIITKTTLSVKMRKWIKDFNPDVIYVQPTSLDGILFCRSIKSFCLKPMVLHVMDDWISLITNKGFFKKFWAKKIDFEFMRLLDKANALMSISAEMSRIYQIKYNREFIPFHNPIDLEFWGRWQRNNYKLPENPVFLYGGRTGLGIDSSLELIANAIQNVNNEFNLSLKFVLQTKEVPSWHKNYSCVEQKKFVEYSDLPKTFSEADFLVLPYDFSPKAIKFIKYSMPTKAPEYMMSGTPIILFAPEETAIVKYCKMFKCAKIITDSSLHALSESIKELIQKESERKRIAQNAKRIAKEKHNSIIVTHDFEKIISSLVIYSNNNKN